MCSQKIMNYNIGCQSTKFFIWTVWFIVKPSRFKSGVPALFLRLPWSFQRRKHQNHQKHKIWKLLEKLCSFQNILVRVNKNPISWDMTKTLSSVQTSLHHFLREFAQCVPILNNFLFTHPTCRFYPLWCYIHIILIIKLFLDEPHINYECLT